MPFRVSGRRGFRGHRRLSFRLQDRRRQDRRVGELRHVRLAPRHRTHRRFQRGHAPHRRRFDGAEPRRRAHAALRQEVDRYSSADCRHRQLRHAGIEVGGEVERVVVARRRRPWPAPCPSPPAGLPATRRRACTSASRRGALVIFDSSTSCDVVPENAPSPVSIRKAIRPNV